MGQFSLQLDGFAKSAMAKADAVCRNVAISLDENIVLKWPVGDPKFWSPASLPAPKGYVGGRSRANWQVGVNEVPSGELFEPNNYVGYPSAAETVDRERERLNQITGNVLYLANNLPYAQRIEDGNWAKAAPAGVVGITVIEFIPLVKAAIAEANV